MQRGKKNAKKNIFHSMYIGGLLEKNISVQVYCRENNKVKKRLEGIPRIQKEAGGFTSCQKVLEVGCVSDLL